MARPKTDHRGHLILVRQPGDVVGADADTVAAEAAAARHLRKFARRRLVRHGAAALLSVVLCGMTAMSCVSNIATGAVRGAQVWVVALAAGGIGCLSLFVGWLLWREFRRSLEWELMNLRWTGGRCMACGFDLRGTPPGADGCRECSECSAAWRL